MKKTCNKCLVEKEFGEFSLVKPGRGDKNNLASRCKKCRAARNLELYNANKEKCAKQRRAYYERNKSREAEQAKSWRIANSARHSENYKNWATANRSLLTLKQNIRSKRARAATPAWLNDVHIDQMIKLYDKARELTLSTGIAHHVDHIMPLKGVNFSGLNVPWNMQVITAFENISKKNKVPDTHKHLIWEEM